MDEPAALTSAPAWAALADGDWALARTGFERTLLREQSGDALDGLAQALFSAGDYAGAIERGELAYAAHRARGQDARAASAARFVGYLHAVVHGNTAVAGGWMGRAVRLIEAVGDCPERARIELTLAVVADDGPTRARHLAAADDIAARYGLTDIVFDVMSQRGLHLVAAGQVPAGMALLDEALAAVAGGEIDDLISIGAMYCKMLLACELTSDVRRAEDWLTQADRFVTRTNRIPIGAICRTHYGGVLTAAGRWAEAEHELTTALSLYDRSYRALRSAALVRSAALRVRQGRLAEATQLLHGNEHDSYAVRPQVELHLACGEHDLAAARAERHLRADGLDVLNAPLLFLVVRAELHRGNREIAVTVADRLATAAAARPSLLLTGLAGHAAGLLAAGRSTTDAVGHLETAIGAFGRLGLPLEEARARLDLATALATDRPSMAVLEARTALQCFRTLGAQRDIDAATSLLRHLGVRGHSGPRADGTLTAREQHVLDLLAEGLTNPAIAARLHLSRRTVEHHVSNILAKLGLTNRAQATAYAARADHPTSPLPPQ